MEQKKELTKLSRSNTTSVRLARRAKIILLASSGYDNTQIAEELGVGRVQVGRWRERYATDGLAGIEQGLPRGGRKPTVDAQELVRLTNAANDPHATGSSAIQMFLARGMCFFDTVVNGGWPLTGNVAYHTNGHQRFIGKIAEFQRQRAALPLFFIGGGLLRSQKDSAFWDMCWFIRKPPNETGKFNANFGAELT